MPDYVAPSATTAQKSQGGQHVRQFTNDSVASASITALNPAAGTTVTWVFLPVSGTYSIQLLYGYSAFAGSNLAGNIRLQVQNITISSLTMVNLANTLQSATFVLTGLQGQSVSLNVIAAEAGGTSVQGTIIATQLG